MFKLAKSSNFGKAITRNISIQLKSFSRKNLKPRLKNIIKTEKTLENKMVDTHKALKYMEQINSLLQYENLSRKENNDLIDLLKDYLSCKDIDDSVIKIIWKNFDKLAITNQNQRIIPTLLRCINQIDIEESLLVFDKIEKNILINLSVFDPETLIESIKVLDRYRNNNNQIFKNLQFSCERLIKQMNNEKLSIIFSVFSQKNYENSKFLLSVINQVKDNYIQFKKNKENSNSEFLTINQVGRLSLGILYKFMNKINDISVHIWAEINEMLINYHSFEGLDNTRLSLSLYIITKSAFYDQDLFEIIDKSISQRIYENNPKTDFENIIRIGTAYSITNQGSDKFWRSFFTYTNENIENLNFISINLLVELFKNIQLIYQKFESDKEKKEIEKIIHEIIEEMEKKILGERILERFSLKEEFIEVFTLQKFCIDVVQINLFSSNLTNICVLLYNQIIKKHEL